MGCTISNYREIDAPVVLAEQNLDPEPLLPSPVPPKVVMERSTDESRTLAAVDTLEIELRRLSVGPADSQITVTSNDDVQEEDSSSSSSESSVALPTELYPGDGTRAGPQETLAPSAPVATDAAVGLLYDHSMEQHYGPDHFERPARIIQLYATLKEQGLMDRCWHLVPRQVGVGGPAQIATRSV
ncbi:hypothetical protein Vretifemale_11377 [Volvox reticuliferus]|uniref:Histone deacetylase n=1 Tax=Volvox reticuliferus TaxID=1737510 RepID=A0A8J4FNL9_9CHLO|nr:hypothetical protein Vretifemale_11377 [Volvox reticuliferus]